MERNISYVEEFGSRSDHCTPYGIGTGGSLEKQKIEKGSSHLLLKHTPALDDPIRSCLVWRRQFRKIRNDFILVTTRTKPLTAKTLPSLALPHLKLDALSLHVSYSII